MTIHNPSKFLPCMRHLLCAGVLGGMAMLFMPALGHTQQTGQQIVQEQAETNEQLIRAALGKSTTSTNLGTDSTTTGTEDESTSSSRQTSIPDTPQPPAIGESVRTTVRSNLRSSCSQRCGNVLQSKLRTCNLAPTPQECANRAQSNFRLCSVQCN